MSGVHRTGGVPDAGGGHGGRAGRGGRGGVGPGGWNGAERGGPSDAGPGGWNGARQGGLSDARQGGPNDAWRGGPSDARQGGPYDTRQGGLSDARQGGPYDTRQVGLSDARQGGPNDAGPGDWNGARQGGPNDARQHSPNSARRGGRNGAPQGGPNRARQGGRGVVALLAARGARTHRKAWAAVFAALVLTSTLLGAFALAVTSAALGHARVERYAAADLVVAGDQNTRYTAKPWGSEPETATAGLTERVRVPERALDVVRGVPGVRAAVADRVFPVGLAGTAATGRPWDAARLAPYALRDGREPQRAGEAVVGHGTAVAGGRVAVRVDGAERTYRVVGVADGPRAAVYFTGGEARRLAGHSGTVDAVGVVADEGVGTGALSGRVRDAVDKAGLRGAGERAKGDAAGLRVLTGDGRGAAEDLTASPARSTLLEILGAVAGTMTLIAVLVVSSTIVQALRQRGHELALLRAVGATPRQLRGAVGREVGRVAVAAAAVGAVLAVPAHLALRALLDARGAVPSGLVLPLPPWLAAAPLVTAGVTVLVARLSALIACGRTAKVRPAQALRESPPGTPRRITGLVLLGLGVSAAGTATLQGGQAAAAAASAAAVLMVIACAVLGPWIATGAMRVLGAPMRRFGGPGGRLAAANCTAAAPRLGAAITPVVLVTAFALVQLAAGATLTHEARAQAREVARADVVVRAEGGLPRGALERIRALPGVSGATEVVHSTVVLAGKEAGEPKLERLPVLGVTPERLTRTLDPDVREGDLAGLRPGTVALSADRARALDAEPGSTVRLRFGDGTEGRLRVAAVYDRGLGTGDFLLARDEVLRHASGAGRARVLVATDGAARTLRAVDAAVPGARVQRDAAAVRDAVRVEPEDQALGEVVTGAAVGAIGAFTVIAVLSTLSLIAVGRRPELTLLRRAGAARSQLRRMLRAEAAAVAVTGLVVGAAVALVPLLAFSLAFAGALPYLPPVQGALIVGVVAATALAGTVPPVRRVLRGRYPTG
ncbi:FtsX-like permease family protein [Streptomyces sp. NPDC017940]|uniref:FtsX-like permease family protein n=1 Tax=Streptomyces sp. NPDC017940 TaxID=3365017 RepID=UPI0037902548